MYVRDATWRITDRAEWRSRGALVIAKDAVKWTTKQFANKHEYSVLM